jgi:hypothetical protein
MGRRSKAYLVEVDASGLRWAKGSTSGGDGTGCVELALAGNSVLLRCSRNRAGDRLTFPAERWMQFLMHVRGA